MYYRVFTHTALSTATDLSPRPLSVHKTAPISSFDATIPTAHPNHLPQQTTDRSPVPPSADADRSPRLSTRPAPSSSCTVFRCYRPLSASQKLLYFSCMSGRSGGRMPPAEKAPCISYYRSVTRTALRCYRPFATASISSHQIPPLPPLPPPLPPPHLPLHPPPTHPHPQSDLLPYPGVQLAPPC